MNKLVEKALDRAAEAIRDDAIGWGAPTLAALTETTAHSAFPVAPSIQQALAEETGLVKCRTTTTGIPSGWGSGFWDVCLARSGAIEQPAVVAEIKWIPGVARYDSGVDQMNYVPWEIFKLGRAVEEGTIECGYVIMGASAAWWEKALGENTDVLDDVGSQKRRHYANLVRLLEDGCDARPNNDSCWGNWSQRRKPPPPAPRAVTLSPLRSSRIRPIDGEDFWELRCVRVTA